MTDATFKIWKKEFQEMIFAERNYSNRSLRPSLQFQLKGLKNAKQSIQRLFRKHPDLLVLCSIEIQDMLSNVENKITFIESVKNRKRITSWSANALFYALLPFFHIKKNTVAQQNLIKYFSNGIKPNFYSWQREVFGEVVYTVPGIDSFESTYGSLANIRKKLFSALCKSYHNENDLSKDEADKLKKQLKTNLENFDIQPNLKEKTYKLKK
jgi:hypothetical protein